MALRVKQSIGGLVLLMALSACAQIGQEAPLLSDTDLASDTEAAMQADEPETPTEPAFPSLFFSWPLGQYTLISPPVEIQNQAILACDARGYDTSYMIHIAIDDDEAVAEFGCRGSD